MTIIFHTRIIFDSSLGMTRIFEKLDPTTYPELIKEGFREVFLIAILMLLGPITLNILIVDKFAFIFNWVYTTLSIGFP